MRTIDREEAERFLAEYCRQIPEQKGRLTQLEYGFEGWLPKVVAEYFRATGERQPEQTAEDPAREPVWQAFYEAVWEFCRRGILRPSPLSSHGRGSSGGLPSGDGFSLTAKGREWLQRSKSGWFPTDPSRFISSLARTSALCGDAFTQRANEAARCNDTGNSFACCAMCGAAAEPILLALDDGRHDRSAGEHCAHRGEV